MLYSVPTKTLEISAHCLKEQGSREISSVFVGTEQSIEELHRGVLKVIMFLLWSYFEIPQVAYFQWFLKAKIAIFIAFI